MDDVFVVYSYIEFSNEDVFKKPNILKIITVCNDENTAKGICETLSDKFNFDEQIERHGKFYKVKYDYEKCSYLL